MPEQPAGGHGQRRNAGQGRPEAHASAGQRASHPRATHLHADPRIRSGPVPLSAVPATAATAGPPG